MKEQCEITGCTNEVHKPGWTRCWPHAPKQLRASVALAGKRLTKRQVTIRFCLPPDADAKEAVERYRYVFGWREGFEVKVEEVT